MAFFFTKQIDFAFFLNCNTQWLSAVLECHFCGLTITIRLLVLYTNEGIYNLTYFDSACPDYAQLYKPLSRTAVSYIQRCPKKFNLNLSVNDNSQLDSVCPWQISTWQFAVLDCTQIGCPGQRSAWLSGMACQKKINQQKMQINLQSFTKIFKEKIFSKKSSKLPTCRPIYSEIWRNCALYLD